MRHRFETEFWAPYPIEQVFGFFANPENLPRIMPTWQKARIESGKLTTPLDMPHVPHAVAGDASELLITFRPLPFVPLRSSWRALITEFVYLSHFCDAQISGPFKSWHHCHRVRSELRDGINGTVVRDEVEYELPLAPISDFACPIANLNIAGLFRYREKETLRLLAEEHALH
ncbi:MAG: hypothetical protein NVS9B15_20170 [Acidobacteriaceae bacterium]